MNNARNVAVGDERDARAALTHLRDHVGMARSVENTHINQINADTLCL